MKLTDKQIKEAHRLEELITRTIKDDKRACIELYMTEPWLFRKGTRTFTVLEPKLHNANNML